MKQCWIGLTLILLSAACAQKKPGGAPPPEPVKPVVDATLTRLNEIEKNLESFKVELRLYKECLRLKPEFDCSDLAKQPGRRPL